MMDVFVDFSATTTGQSCVCVCERIHGYIRYNNAARWVLSKMKYRLEHTYCAMCGSEFVDGVNLGIIDTERGLKALCQKCSEKVKDATIEAGW